MILQCQSLNCLKSDVYICFTLLLCRVTVTEVPMYFQVFHIIILHILVVANGLVMLLNSMMKSNVLLEELS